MFVVMITNMGGKWGSIAGLEKQLRWEISEKFLRFIQIYPVWSNPRESWILDYTLWIPNSCQCNLNSRFQSLALFRILWVEFRIPKSTSNNFPDLDSGIRYMERPNAGTIQPKKIHLWDTRRHFTPTGKQFCSGILKTVGLHGRSL